ncbi:hypothetical protein FYJ51_05920 [Erysipelotrichaceae bacterium Oil+RF-744-GAM-WT-6]|uniref:Uncharacterized protein n=1 Tax=Stecheria intestinalis TaxID=2606630 RepID=A0A7X2NS56_9FIRM|nr:hypothetical protein [Stecheria intestinalis]MSS58438.1 hypothetical protein [Stecheria intestinalis]
MMLTDEIKDVTEKINELNRLENNKQNEEDQLRTDNSFRDNTEMLYKDYLILKEAKNRLGFELSEDTANIFDKSIQCLDQCITGGKAQEDAVQNTNKIIADLEKRLRKEWTSFYRNKTVNPSRQLDVGKSLLSLEEYSEHRKNIDGGQNWSDLPLTDNQGKTKLQKCADSIAYAGSLLNMLKITDGVRQFLIRVSKGEATVSDLDDEVITWIRSEHREDMFGITFK